MENRSPNRDLNSGHSEYDAGVLPIRPQRLVRDAVVSFVMNIRQGNMWKESVVVLDLYQ
jgi:hypothetical protein